MSIDCIILKKIFSLRKHMHSDEIELDSLNDNVISWAGFLIVATKLWQYSET